MAASHPGERHTVDRKGPPVEKNALLADIAACLMDHEVTFALDGPWNSSMGPAVSRRTGARAVEWDRADFVFVCGGTSLSRIGQARRGSLAYPDRGATVIYCLDESPRDDGSGLSCERVRLTGPGVERPLHPQVEGVTMDEYRLLGDMNRDYPLGVDAFVIKENRYIMGLPRSTHIEVN